MKRTLATYSNKFTGCFLLLICVTGLSCKKFVTVDLPVDKVTAETVFSNEETATSAVVGIYSQMMPTIPFYSCGGTTIYAGLSADEFQLTNATNAEDVEFEQNKLSVANSTLSFNFWQRAYKIIYQSNACIEKLSASSILRPLTRDQLLGEAKFIRAFHYFYLLNLFGEVPLVTGTDYRKNALLPRTPAREIYAQIVSDLMEAKSLLAAVYPSAGRVRPNKQAAIALLARVYLYQQDWAAAEKEATEIINTGAYSLLTNLADVFLATSNEAIWQLMPVESGFNTTEARSFIPTTSASTKPAYAVTSQLLAAFEQGDARKSAWLASKTVAGQPYYYPFKYKVRNLSLPVTEYYMVLRYAEQLLIRAEARAHQDNITGAKHDLDSIRSRAGLPPSIATDKESLLTAIEHERQIELMAEWGHRWFDLRRTGKVDAVIGNMKPSWQSSAALFPIPLTEILQNPSLTQNQGY